LISKIPNSGFVCGSVAPSTVQNKTTLINGTCIVFANYVVA